MNFPASFAWPEARVRAWTTAFDAFAAASEAAVAATAERDLLAAIARALAGPFADWVIVDRIPRRQVSSSGPGRGGEPRLATAIAALSVSCCPLIVSAMEQRTPLVRASAADPAELGILRDGRRVVDALGAESYAVSPMTAGDAALGAITILRGRSRPHVTFVELNVLAHIADLTAAAIGRMKGPALRVTL